MAQYADIVGMDVPSPVAPGKVVYMTVDVKNLYSAVISVRVSGIVFVDTTAYSNVTFDPDWFNPPAGAIYRFIGRFVMPNSNAMIHVVSYWYGADGNWHIDDTMDAYVTLAEAPLAEIKEIWYFDPGIGTHNPELTEPPTIQIGEEAGAQFNLYNVSDGYLDLGLFITAFDPFGNALGAKKAGPTSLPPGGSFGVHYREVTKFPGTYTFTVDIITSNFPPYGIIGTLEKVPVAYVVGEIPPLAGHVYQPFVVDATTGETFYSADLPVGIDGGHKVIVGIRWMNDGGETATFTPTFELVDPDGISREVQTFTTELSPTEHTAGQTGKSVELDKLGIWKIHASLKADGTLLDEKTWDVAIVATLPEPAGFSEFKIYKFEKV